MGNISRRLLEQGDRLAIEGGRIAIVTKSGKPVPDDWMTKNAPIILNQIVKATGATAFQYEGYTAGHYGKHKAGGLTIQYTQVLTGESSFVVFNADLKRARSTERGKKGSPLPVGQFRVGKGNAFVKFWKTAGLILPRRLTAFHDYMGRLSGIVFSGDCSDTEKLDKKTIRPLCLSHEQLLKAFSIADLPDNSRTRVPDKEPEDSHIQQGFQADSATGDFYYGNKVKGNTGEGSKVIPILTPISKPIGVEDKSVEEWLDDYGLPD